MMNVEFVNVELVMLREFVGFRRIFRLSTTHREDLHPNAKVLTADYERLP